MPSKVTNRPLTRPKLPAAQAVPLGSPPHARTRHRRSRLHRIQPRRRSARPRRRGDRARRPLHRQAREPRRTRSPTARELHEVDIRDAAARGRAHGRDPARGRLPPGRPDRRAQVGRRPAADARINVEGTINVLDAARRAGAPRVVNTSTGGAIYGEGRTIPAPEDHPVAPEAPYGLSKFCAEGYCDLFTRLHGLSTVSLRYGNVYGPRQDPLGEAGVIAIFCGKLLEGGTAHRVRRRPADPRLRLRGRRGGGQPARRGVRRRPARSTSAPAWRPRCSTSWRRSPARPTARASRPRWPPSAPARCATSHLDATRAQAELGWQPEVGIGDGLERTLASLR